MDFLQASSQNVCKKTPDFDAKLRHYTKNFYGGQKVQGVSH
jgi:hypothetical protein